nr:MAG TPA: hypothetical protein [Caudoviricetes sp.]
MATLSQATLQTALALRQQRQVLHGKAAAWQGFARHSDGMEMQRVATELLS